MIEAWYACSQPDGVRGVSVCHYQPVKVRCEPDYCYGDWTIVLNSWRAVVRAGKFIRYTTTFIVALAETVKEAIVTWSEPRATTCMYLNTSRERFCPGDDPRVIHSSVLLRIDGDTIGEVTTGWGFEIALRECGDGRRHFGEGCDDGNLISGDGCSAFCQVEKDYACELEEYMLVCSAELGSFLVNCSSL